MVWIGLEWFGAVWSGGLVGWWVWIGGLDGLFAHWPTDLWSTESGFRGGGGLSPAGVRFGLELAEGGLEKLRVVVWVLQNLGHKEGYTGEYCLKLGQKSSKQSW